MADKFFNETLKEFEGLMGPSVCNICDRDIGKSIKIRCMECTSPLSLCLDCLRNKRTKPEFPAHKATHDYYVYDGLDFPLLMKDWSAKDELQLIQGIMKCGVGNWKDISEQYVKGHNAQECEDHYYTFYNKGKEDFLPKDEDFIIQSRYTASTSSRSGSSQMSQ